MFTESEIAFIYNTNDIKEPVKALFDKFKKEEAPYLDIEEVDFLSLVLMVPQVGISMADGKISFFEEMALQKKARKFSKGGFFMSKDPVADAMKFIVRNYEKWEKDFCELLGIILNKLFSKDELKHLNDKQLSYEQKLLKSPYLFTRFISSLFYPKDEDILQPIKIKKSEWEKIRHISEVIGLSQYDFQDEFLAKFQL